MRTSLYNNYRNEIRVLVLLVAAFNIFLLTKIFFIQVVHHDKYKNILDEETTLIRSEQGERGKIYDINGSSLADNITRYDFWVNTAEPFDKYDIATAFAKAFNRDLQYYLNLLNNEHHHLKLETNVEKLYCKSILDSINQLQGLRRDFSIKRFYPYDNLASTVVGFFNREQNSSGIEDYFYDVLSGQEIDVTHQILDNKQIKINNVEIPAGKDIKLTIDLNLQSILVNELKKGLDESDAEFANGIIVDPNSGFILAMASVPDFNANKYQNFNSANYKNRVISDSYEPGSTYKIVALTAAMESSKIDLKDSLYCENGSYRLKNGHLLHDHEPHEMLSVPDIFAFSSNIGMAKISSMLSNQEIYDKSRQFGFGVDTGILLPNEESGVLRSPENWTYQSNASVAIGQEISCTSLQLAMAYSSIANGGYLVQPIIVESVDGKIINKAPVIIRKVMNTNTSKNMLALLERVVDYGGGQNAYLEGFDVGGKTGTAQKFIDGQYSESKYISSFASIFPVDNPEYVCVISVDSPDKKRGKHWGGETAAPITKEIYKKIINLKDIKSETFNLHVNNNTNEINEKYYSSNTMPDFRGKTLKQSVKMGQALGIEISPVGYSGRVVWQSVKAGSETENIKICELKIE